MKVLLIEDEKRMAQALCEILRQEGYLVDYCSDGLDGAAALKKGNYDVAILDVMLPHKDGFSIAQEARESNVETPILMLTAKSDVEDTVRGLDCGADDYLTKPFLTKELLARLRALCRRRSNRMEAVAAFGDIALRRESSSLVCGGNSVRLSDKEFRILEYLIANHGRILSREQIALHVWGYDNEAEYNNVEVYLSFTRRKLAFVKAHTEIKAVRGIGYELRCSDV